MLQRLRAWLEGGRRPMGRLYHVAWIGLIVGLLIKFLWPLVAFDVPLGYDPGLYRYLFVRHAEAWPPFVLAALDPWARGHPLGLFFFTSLLLKAGLPVDWLIGWIWNLVPVALAAVYARIMARRFDRTIGLLTLLAFLLSVASFDGFAAMYWKTYAALLWMILAFAALERRSWWSVPLGILTVATHHQTGLLFGLAFLTWIILPVLPFARSTGGGGDDERRNMLRLYDVPRMVVMIGMGVVILIIGAATYAPIWQDAVLVHVPALLDRSQAAAGSFPGPLFYLQTSGILLALGIVGWFVNVRRERWTLWQLAFLWSAAFVLLRLFFYRRFLLQLDFFLLPFAAIGMRFVWLRWRQEWMRGLLIALLVAQGIVLVLVMRTRGPIILPETYAAVARMPGLVPDDALILSLENRSAVVLRGWLPRHRVGGPGLFDAPWSYQEWESFLLGSADERRAFLRMLPEPTYLFVSAFFRSHYGAIARTVLGDACLVPVREPFLYRVSCPPASDD